MNEEKGNKMGIMPIKKLLFQMSLPMILSMTIQALYNVVDSMFVAKISENALSAVSLAFPMQNFIISVSVGIGVGVNSLLSKNLGQHNFKSANKVASVSLFLAFCSWLMFVFIALFFIDFYLKGQTDVQEIIDLGRAYLRICLFGSLGIFIQVTTEKLLQSTGLTTYNMMVQGTGAIINIILDPILIFGLFGMPALGVAGAGIATVIGQFSGATLGLYLNYSKNKEIKITTSDMLPTKTIVSDIFKIAIPSILMLSVGSVMVFFLNKILNSFTPTAIAVFGSCYKLQSFVMMPVFGITNSVIPIVAYNYGALKMDRIKETIRHAIIWSIAIMTTGMFIFQLFPRNLLSIFDASPEMLAIGIPALKIISLCYPTAAFNIVCSSVYQALGCGSYSLVVSLTRQLIFLLPIAYVLSLSSNLELVWLCFPISEIIGFSLSIFLIRKLLKFVSSEIEKSLLISN